MAYVPGRGINFSGLNSSSSTANVQKALQNAGDIFTNFVDSNNKAKALEQDRMIKSQQWQNAQVDRKMKMDELDRAKGIRTADDIFRNSLVDGKQSTFGGSFNTEEMANKAQDFALTNEELKATEVDKFVNTDGSYNYDVIPENLRESIKSKNEAALDMSNFSDKYYDTNKDMKESEVDMIKRSIGDLQASGQPVTKDMYTMLSAARDNEATTQSNINKTIAELNKQNEADTLKFGKLADAQKSTGTNKDGSSKSGVGGLGGFRSFIAKNINEDDSFSGVTSEEVSKAAQDANNMYGTLVKSEINPKIAEDVIKNSLVFKKGMFTDDRVDFNTKDILKRANKLQTDFGTSYGKTVDNSTQIAALKDNVFKRQSRVDALSSGNNVDDLYANFLSTKKPDDDTKKPDDDTDNVDTNTETTKVPKIVVPKNQTKEQVKKSEIQNTDVLSKILNDDEVLNKPSSYQENPNYGSTGNSVRKSFHDMFNTEQKSDSQVVSEQSDKLNKLLGEFKPTKEISSIIPGSSVRSYVQKSDTLPDLMDRLGLTESQVRAIASNPKIDYKVRKKVADIVNKNLNK